MTRNEFLPIQPLSQDSVGDTVAAIADSMQHPLALGVGVGAGLILAAATVGAHHLSKEKQATPVINDALLRHTLHEVGADTSAAQRASTWYRTGALAGVLFAGSMTAGLYASGVTHDVERPNPSSEVVLIVDGSSTMKAADMMGGITRSAAAEQAIAGGTLDFSGKIALIAVGNNTDLVLPMSESFSEVNTQRLAANEPLKIDPNGGDIMSGLKEAAALLPFRQVDGAEPKREGSIVVISDGTHSNKQALLDETITKVEAQGPSIHVIVPGTTEGTYKLGSADVLAGITPESFQAIDASRTAITDDPSALTAAIQGIMKQEGTQTSIEPYDLPWQIGGGVTGAALALLVTQIVRRKI